MVITTTPLYYATTLPYNHITTLQIYNFGVINKPIGLYLFPTINIFSHICLGLRKQILF